MRLWSRFVAATEAWADFDPFPEDEARIDALRWAVHVMSHDAEVWELRARGLGWKEPPR